MFSLSVVLPCHNEAEAIASVIPALRDSLEEGERRGWLRSSQIIVVDDASSDDSAALLRRYSDVELVTLFTRSGYGSALKTGFARATGDWIAFLDIDGTYDPRDLELFLAAALEAGPDVLSGERFSRGEGMPRIRGFGNALFSWLVARLYASPLRDPCSGYRMFRRTRLEEVLHLPHEGLNFSLAMTLWTLQRRVPVRELAIRYHARQGESKLHVVGDGMRFLGTILSGYYSFRRLPKNG